MVKIKILLHCYMKTLAELRKRSPPAFMLFYRSPLTAGLDLVHLDLVHLDLVHLDLVHWPYFCPQSLPRILHYVLGGHG